MPDPNSHRRETGCAKERMISGKRFPLDIYMEPRLCHGVSGSRGYHYPRVGEGVSRGKGNYLVGWGW